MDSKSTFHTSQALQYIPAVQDDGKLNYTHTTTKWTTYAEQKTMCEQNTTTKWTTHDEQKTECVSKAGFSALHTL